MKKLQISEELWVKILKEHQGGDSPLTLSRRYNFNYEALRSRIRKSGFYVPRSNRFYENPGLKESIFEKINTSSKAYWLGFLAADGNVCKTKNWQYIIQLYLDIKDKDHVEKFNKFIGNKRSIRINTRSFTNIKDKPSTRAICAVSSKKMFNDLLLQGITPKKSLTLKWPKLDDEKLYWDFIRGYWDGDGTIGENYIGLIGSLNFLKSLDDFISRKIGLNTLAKIKLHISSGRYKGVPSKTYELRYFSISAGKIIKELYGYPIKKPVLFRKGEKAAKLFLKYKKYY